jgi:excisionase family DNA binding protein
MKELPLRALYSVAELARAGGVERRKMRRLLQQAGVRVLRVGKLWCVSVSELEERVPTLWEGIRSVETLRHVGDGL